MKIRLILSLLVICLTGNEAVSQVKQNCRVVEYRGEKGRKPLSNVTVVVSGAGSNVSDKNGFLCLTFRELVPGNKVVVRKIELEGYEVFNRDAIDNWRISGDDASFDIVLCRSSSFKAMKDKYYSISSDSYAAQLKMETDRVKALLDEGKIKEKEYLESVREIRNQYDEQLENLDNYIDRFARIDLANISAEERRIVQMVRNGRIDDAIKAYDDLKIMDKIRNLTDQIATVDVSINKLEKKKSEDISKQNELYASLDNMINLLMIKGGRDNINRIMELHEQAALAMPDNGTAVLECAIFYQQQHHFRKSREWYDRYLECPTSSLSDRAFAECKYSEVCIELGLVDECAKHIGNSFKCLDGIKDKTEKDMISFLGANHSKALLCQISAKYGEAVDCWLNLLPQCDSLIASVDNKEQILLMKFSINANLSELLTMYGKGGQSLKLGEEMVEFAKPRFDPKRFYSMHALAVSYNQYGYALLSTGQNDKAVESLMQALEIFLPLYEKNPDSTASDLALTYNRLTLAYFAMGDIDKAMEYGLCDLKFKEEASAFGGDFAMYDYAQALNNMGYMAFLKKQYDLSRDYYEKAMPIDEGLCEKYPDVYLVETNRVHINMMSLLLALKSYGECAELDSKCLEEAEYLNNRDKDLYLDNYLLTYFNHGEYCLATGDNDGARKAVGIIIGVNPDYFKTRTDSSLSSLVR